MISLGIFLSRHGSLKKWDQVGIRGRELAIYATLAEAGVKTTVFSYSSAEHGLSLPEVPGGSVQAVSSAWLLSRLRFLRPGAYRLRRALKQLDLVKSNQLIGGREAAAAAAAAGVPLIIRSGYIPSRDSRACGAEEGKIQEYLAEEAAGLRQAALVITTTASLRDYLVATHGLSPEKIRIIGNYVPQQFFMPSHEPQAPDAGFCVLTVGRHHPQKGYDLLMATLADMPDVTWRCIGGGEGLASDAEACARLGIKAEFIERVSHEEMPRHYRWAHAFVLCSRWEGHPKVLLEAMASGCACVVAKAPGTLDDVSHEATALVVEPSAVAIGEALKRLRDNADLRQRLGAAASAYVAERYSLARIAQEELAVYREALAMARS